MMYAIGIANRNGVYLEWCDEHWYGTTRDKLFQFSEDNIETIVSQMLSHYVYGLEIEGEDGHKETRVYKTKFQRELEKSIKPKENPLLETQYQQEKVSACKSRVWKIRRV